MNAGLKCRSFMAFGYWNITSVNVGIVDQETISVIIKSSVSVSLIIAVLSTTSKLGYAHQLINSSNQKTPLITFLLKYQYHLKNILFPRYVLITNARMTDLSLIYHFW